MINAQFPKLSAKNLEGRAFAIPGDLTGTANLIILAFLREHQQAVEGWLPYLAQLREEFPGLEQWAVPVISRRYRMWRGAIDSGMRAGIADPQVRGHTLITYMDLHDLQRSLGLSDLDHIQLYLVDRRGRVDWEGSGEYDAGTLDSLRDALKRLLGGA